MNGIRNTGRNHVICHANLLKSLDLSQPQLSQADLTFFKRDFAEDTFQVFSRQM